MRELSLATPVVLLWRNAISMGQEDCDAFAFPGDGSLFATQSTRFLTGDRLNPNIHIKRCIKMRTNVILDEALVQEAMRLSGAKTKKDVIHLALEALVRELGRKDLRELRGKITFTKGFDPDQLRAR
jgi:Arc/MetJ family transcription regulator